MNRDRLLIIGIVFLTLIHLVSAEITIDINIRDSFSLGEKIFFNYTIIPNSDTQSIIIPHIECPSAPIALIMEKTINLTKNMPYKAVYYGMVIEDFIEPQTCTAYVEIINPIQQIEEKTFRIVTNPSFEFNINFCKDQSCTQKSKIFLKNENIYIDYYSDVLDPAITAFLTYPDKTTQQLISEAPIKAEQIGTYTLEVTASKEGYKTITKKQQFAVIEKEAEIPFVSVCNTDGICDGKENYQNCAQDCPSGAKDNYCDKIEDGKCDPDCAQEEDIDCLQEIQETQREEEQREEEVREEQIREEEIIEEPIEEKFDVKKSQPKKGILLKILFVICGIILIIVIIIIINHFRKSKKPEAEQLNIGDTYNFQKNEHQL